MLVAVDGKWQSPRRAPPVFAGAGPLVGPYTGPRGSHRIELGTPPYSAPAGRTVHLPRGGVGVREVLGLLGGQGAGRRGECVIYQCCTMHGKEVLNLAMNDGVHGC